MRTFIIALLICFASYKTLADKKYPPILTDSKDNFVNSLSYCIDWVYYDLPSDQHIPKELVIAQAALETGWGKSRFANEGNNLFGIRTYDKEGEWLLPIPWTKWPGWGVKKYNSRCESVIDYVRIINELWAYEELRKVRDNNGDVYEMADKLENYAKNPDYTILVKSIIKNNLSEYEL
jgi:Bax protein